jgi:O-6-methylguanine DNA methyltransferase
MRRPAQGCVPTNGLAEPVYGAVVFLGPEWGWFALAGTATGLRTLTYGHPDESQARHRILEEHPGVRLVPAEATQPAWLPNVVRQVTAYLRGELSAFSIPLELHGTEFQRQVWEATRAIPYGKVVTYQALAHQVGKPGAARAVGNAMANNPVPLIVPCHRVVASQGKLGGYSQGLHWKERLLKLESSRANVTLPYNASP